MYIKFSEIFCEYSIKINQIVNFYVFLPFDRFSATFYIFFSSFCKFRQGKNLTNPI